MVTQERWKEAQAYEKSYWENQANQIASGSASQLDWYSWKAKKMEERLGNFFPEEKRRNARVLEIGSGPIGIVTYLPWGKRHTLDPLEPYYASNPTLTKLRSPEVVYGAGGGEKVPFEDGSMSLVILDNVLDHVHEAPRVLEEIRRVVSRDGVFYLEVNIHTVWGGFLHRILSRLKIDRGHPYTFTLESIRRFLQQHGFAIKKDFYSNYADAKKASLQSASMRERLKGMTGLTEFVYQAICEKA